MSEMRWGIGQKGFIKFLFKKQYPHEIVESP